MKDGEINDFGFTTFGDDYFEDIKAREVGDYQDKIRKMVELILPLLENLSDTADKPTIYWPNRREKIDPIIEKIKKLAEL